MFYFIINFFINFVLFLTNFILGFLYLYFKRFTIKAKKDDELLQYLSEIDIKCNKL